MKFIHAENPTEGIGMLAENLGSALLAGKKVLWLIAGGSNVPIAVEVRKKVREMMSVDKSRSLDLMVTLTDERFGLVGHPDSNWRQLAEAGFDFENVQKIPVLNGLEVEETARVWGKEVEKLFNLCEVVVGQFGLGSDGHIAGVLPDSEAVKSLETVAVTRSKTFTRVTLTLKTVKTISQAYVFAFGESKKEMLQILRDRNVGPEEQPAQILKEMEEVYLFSDN